MNEFYITSHAVEQFQTRIALLPPQEVRREILSQFLPWECELFGYARWNRRIDPFFLGRYEDKKYLIPLQADMEGKGRGILVPTILTLDAAHTVHWERNKDKAKAKWLVELKGIQM